MDETATLHDLFSRTRGGDVAAAEELVRRYETVVRAAVRIRLTDPALRRQFDSQDVCQSVLFSFYVRAAAGLYDIERPEHLVGRLVRMAEYKCKARSRDARRLRRDVGRVDFHADPDRVAAPGPGPVDQAIGRDLLAAVNRRLTADERQLVARRTAGCTWPEIAAELGGTAQALRVQLDRALSRAASELGLDAPDDLDD